MKQTEMKKDSALKKFLDGPVRWYDWLILAAIAAFCFVSYEMRDLFHTAGCSYGFLDGHFADFYDYLAQSGIGEDGSQGLHASYMPTVYLIFAVWNIPMKLFGIVPKATAQLGFVPIMWAKLLPCLVYIACGVLVFRIAKELGMGERKAKIVLYAALSMPVGLYGQFILGQYESFITFCVLAGVYCWLKKKTVPFIAWFAAAVTFKYTALLLFLPLLLLREKKIWKILVETAAVFALFALEYVLFMGSPAFKLYAFGVGSGGDNPTGYITNAAYFTGFDLGGNLKYMVYLTFIAFAFVCAAAYFRHTKDKNEENRYAMYFLCLALGALFCFSKWHPHWLMLAVPFWTITAFMHRDTKIFMAVDLLFMGLFVLFCTVQFSDVCDEVMLEKGIFKFLLPDGKLNHAVTMADYLDKLDMSIELSLLTAIMGVYAVFKHPKYMEEDLNRAADASMGWIRARYIIGMLIFIVPSILVLKGTLAGPALSYREDRREVRVEFKEESEVLQRFESQGTYLSCIRFPVSRGENFSCGTLTVTLEETDGTVLYEKELAIDSLREGALASVKPGISVENGKTYQLRFRTAPEEEMSFALLGSTFDAPYENAERDGAEKPYHLDLLIFQ